MNSGIVLEFDASHHAVVVLLGLGAILVLPLARTPLLKLYWQRATSVLPGCVCYLAHLGPTSLQQKAAAQESHLWDSHQLAESKMVLSREHVVQKR